MSAASAHPNFYRVTQRRPCPVCRKTDWCRIFDDGGVECMRLAEGGTPCASGGYMHWPGGRPENWQDALRLLPPPTPRPVLDVELADRAYRALLGRLVLSAEHQASLHARGLTAEQIARHGYATAPANKQERQALTAAVAAELGCDLAGLVPGFIHRGGTLDLACGGGEILIPARDVQGRIVGIRRRLDEPGDEGKYRWMSWGDGPHSIGIDGNTVHVAHPLRLRTNYKVIVEGEIKANLTADAYGCVVISVPGVGNIQRVLPALEVLDATDVVIAYDSDANTNPAVAAGETKLAHLLINGGYQVAQWTWPQEDAKGIDDLIALGLHPFPVPHPALKQAHDGAMDAEATAQGSDMGDRMTRLQTERDAALATAQARARLQRNKRLPARPMANALVGLFAQKATASDPAGSYTGKIPAGYVVAPVNVLAEEAGCSENSGGLQLKKLEEAGLIVRTSRKETLLAGQIDPDTGERLTQPKFYSRHFVAIPGHEDEAPSVAAVRDLIERMATFTTEEPERRGGKRIPRCELHPHAAVIKHWEARCSECDAILETGEDLVPAMHLESLPPDALFPAGTEHQDHESSAPFPETQTLGLRGNPVDMTQWTHRKNSLPGNRPIGPKKLGSGEDGSETQSLGLRVQAAAEDLARRQAQSLAPSPMTEEPPEPERPALFVIESSECWRCGAVIPDGTSYCMDCDPHTA